MTSESCPEVLDMGRTHSKTKVYNSVKVTLDIFYVCVNICIYVLLF